MTRIRTHVLKHPIVIISFDDDYASRFVRELEGAFPTLHITPLIRTLKTSMESLQPSIAVFDLQTIKTEDHSIFEIMKSLDEAFPYVRKIALGNQNMPAQVISAMKAGACDFLDRGASPDEIREVMTTHMGQVRIRQNDSVGRVLALVSGRENEGENEITANLATYIASKRPKGEVLLLDLTLEETQLDIEFNVEITYSVRNAIDELLRLDKQVLMQVLAQHSSGLYLLPLTTRSHKDDEIAPQELMTLLSALRSFFPIIVIKAGCLRDHHCRPYLAPLCDRLLLVCPQVIGSIRIVRDIVADYRTVPEDHQKLALIISKYDSSVELVPAQIAERLGIPLAAAIPAAWASIANSHNQGMPLVLSLPNSRYARAIADIGQQLLTDPSAEHASRQISGVRTLIERLGILKRAG